MDTVMVTEGYTQREKKIFTSEFGLDWPSRKQLQKIFQSDKSAAFEIN